MIHVIDGNSNDPIGDFKMINQELESYDKNLVNKTQVIAINKLDIPEVKSKFEQIKNSLLSICGHSRIIGISAATGYKIKELMQRVKCVIDSLPPRHEFELFTEDEAKISFEDEDNNEEDNSFEIKYDINIPGQFQIVGKKIEKVIF